MHPFLSRKRRGGKRKADFPPVLPSWPVALRKVRSWLEPYVMLVRYWRAFSDLCPRPRSYESCLRGCSPERAFTSMSADNKLPLVLTILQYSSKLRYRARERHQRQPTMVRPGRTSTPPITHNH